MKKFLSFILTLCACFAIGGLIQNNVVNAAGNVSSATWSAKNLSGNPKLVTTDFFTISIVEGEDVQNTATFKSDSYRIYTDAEFTFTWTSNLKLTKLVFNFTKTGFSFGTGTDLVASQKISNNVFSEKLTAQVRLTSIDYAYVLDETKATLTYDSNLEGATTVASDSIKKNEEFTMTKVPTHEHYDFIGWFDMPEGGNKYENNKITISDNTTVYAHWNAHPKTTIIFDHNDNKTTEVTLEYWTGNTIVEIPNHINRESENLKFSGWKDIETGDVFGMSDSPALTYEKDRMLQAQWSVIPTYDVTFEDGFNNTVDEVKTVKENKTVAEPTDPVRVGYEFLGWYKEPECTSKWNFYSDHVTANTTLYAKWEALSFTSCNDIESATPEELKKGTPINMIIKVVSESNNNYTITDGISETNLFDKGGNNSSKLKKDCYYQVSGKTGYYNSKSVKQIVLSSSYDCVQITPEDIFVATSAKASLRVLYDVQGEAEKTYTINDVYLRFGGLINGFAYDETAKYGVIVVEPSQKLPTTIEEFDKLDKASKESTGNVLELTPVLVNGGYQFSWAITNTEGHYDTALTAVMYMIKDGKLYLSESTTESVLSTRDKTLSVVTDETLKAVLNAIK